jgi:copper chaperone CopZ
MNANPRLEPPLAAGSAHWPATTGARTILSEGVDEMAFTTTEKSASTVIFHVEGMACSSCAGRVDEAIHATPGVVSSLVDLAAKRATVTFSGAANPQAVVAAIVEAGYEANVEAS